MASNISKRAWKHRAVVGLGVVGLTATAFTTGAFANPPSSTLQASPNSVSLDISGVSGFSTNPTSRLVNVGLDSGCLNVFIHGQAYSVAATSENTAVATVSPDVSPGIHCGDTTGFTVSTFAYNTNLLATDPVNVAACNAVGNTNVDFAPVAGPAGIQKKLAGTSVPVAVHDANNLCAGSGGGGGGGGGADRPAAPAVANAYLNAADSTVLNACKSAFGNAKSWRGGLISFIAAWMPKPESVKEAPPVGVFTDANDWIDYVQSEVNIKCNDGIAPTFDPTSLIPPLVAYST